MNSGTWICAPVSSVAGLVPPVDRSPCRPGSVWLTVSSTAAGSSTYSGTPSLKATPPFCSSGRLVVGFGVHEHEGVAFAVQVLHLAPVHAGLLDPPPGVEGPGHDLPGHHV